MLTIVITLVYFLPVILISYHAWNDSVTSERNAHKSAFVRFFDMFAYILLRSELGSGGLVLASIIHFQLYMLVFFMMWCASHVKTIVDKVQELKDTQGGSYQGLELLGVEDALETKEVSDDKAAGVGAAIGPLAEDIIPQEEQKIGELL